MTTAGCGDACAGGVNGRKWRGRRDNSQASRSRKERPVALTSLLALARAEKSTTPCRIPDYVGLSTSTSRRERHPNRQTETFATGKPRKHPIASLNGQLLAPPSADSLMLQREASPVYPPRHSAVPTTKLVGKAFFLRQAAVCLRSGS
jgi:hypothetical protein